MVVMVEVLLVHAEVGVAVHGHVQDVLRVVVLEGTGLLARRLLPERVHNPFSL